MSTRRLIIWITFLAIFTMAARISMDTDTWWHLRAGQWMVENRTILTTDQFSYTRIGESWQYPGWIIEIPMYAIYQLLGPGGLNIWTAFMVTVSFYFVWLTMSGGPFLRAFVLIIAATASGVYWSARPHLVTILFTAVFLFSLERYRLISPLGKNKWNKLTLYILAFVMIFWVNSHGGFIVGFLIWGVYWVDEFVRNVWKIYQEKSKIFEVSALTSPLTWLGIIMVIAVCINPAGPSMLLYPFNTVGIGALQEYIQEWQSPNFHSLQVQPFAWLMFLTFGIIGFSKRRLIFIDFVLFTTFAFLGFLAGRNIALFALVIPMVISRHLDPLLESYRRIFGVNLNIDRTIRSGRKILNGLVFGVLVIMAIIKISAIYPAEVNEKVFKETLPINPIKYIHQTKPPGNLFNSYNWGGYLLWALPEYPVFVDGRTDLYDDEIITQWLMVVKAEVGWYSVLEKWQVKLILLELNLPIENELEENGWIELYRDEIAVIYKK